MCFHRTASSNARVLNLSVHILSFLQSYPRITDNVFLNDQGEVWTTTSYYKHMAEDRTAIDLNRHWDSFSFRRSFAYHFLKTGKTLHQLQVVLGHRHIAKTIGSYGDIVSDSKNVKFWILPICYSYKLNSLIPFVFFGLGYSKIRKRDSNEKDKNTKCFYEILYFFKKESWNNRVSERFFYN